MIPDNIFCNLLTLDGINYQCVNCGIRISVTDDLEDPPMLLCRGIFDFNRHNSEQSFVNSVQTIADNTTEQINTTPSSQEQILSRYNICQQCEFFKNYTCEKCGCAVNRNKIYANKLAWSDQVCPIGKW
jgi:predicted RNA-binding Zn-ribbon protein involved in translation (DUF1610 family)